MKLITVIAGEKFINNNIINPQPQAKSKIYKLIGIAQS